MRQARYDGPATLARAARQATRVKAGWPALFALTDPARTPDRLALARSLPAGCGLILRHFGDPVIRAEAPRLAELCRSRGVRLLVAADGALAEAIKADGVHWPNARLSQALAWRRRRPGWLITASAHTESEFRRAGPVADAILVSSVFASASPSAGKPIGPWRASAFARRSGTPVYALGGVDMKTVKRLKGLGFGGIAAIGGAITEPPV
ncbi:MAG: thiamine phosphate synthase [Pseudomonadota bacterium]